MSVTHSGYIAETFSRFFAEFVGEVMPPFSTGETGYGDAKKVMYFSDRAGLFSALGQTKNSYAFSEPISAKTLEKFGLKEIAFVGAPKYLDMLIYPFDYYLSKTDKDFITALCLKKRNIIG